MKTIFLVFTFFVGIVTYSQDFYEIKWESSSIEYTALVVFYDMDNITVRVKYTVSGDFKVAEFECVAEIDYDEDDNKYLTFDGYDATMVYNTGSYNADNFIFTNINALGVYKDVYAIDDVQLEYTDYYNYLHDATYRILNPKYDFTETYLYNFYEKEEYEYKKFIKLAGN